MKINVSFLCDCANSCSVSITLSNFSILNVLKHLTVSTSYRAMNLLEWFFSLICFILSLSANDLIIDLSILLVTLFLSIFVKLYLTSNSLQEAPCLLLWCRGHCFSVQQLQLAAQCHLLSLIAHLEVPWPGASPDPSEEEQCSSSYNSQEKVASSPLAAHTEVF